MATITDAKLQRLNYLRQLLQEQEGLTQKSFKPWSEQARPEQLAPEGDWFVWLILAGRGWGKAVSTVTPIPTPRGWVKLGDVQVGDTVFDEAGKPCRVTAVFDSVPQTAYRLTFSDGSYIDACDEHQWVTWTARDMKAFNRSSYDKHHKFPENWPNWRQRRFCGGNNLSREVVEKALAMRHEGLSVRAIGRALGISRSSLTVHLNAGHYVGRSPRVYSDSPGPRVRTTQDIVDTLTTGKRQSPNHVIPVCGSLELPELELPLHPYVLGIWLGDGDKSDATFCTMDPEIIAEVETSGYIVQQLKPDTRGNKACGYRFRDADGKQLRTLLRKMSIWRSKHVPSQYLRASVSQRLALLQGLMDSDGGGDAGRVSFTNTNRNLADAVLELARSLGQVPIMRERRAELYGKDCGPVWEVTWRPTIPVFRLPRKLKHLLPFDKPQIIRHHHRRIVKAEQISPVPMRCLTVDSPNRMFLIGEAMIPTHNTRTAAEWSCEKARHYKGCRIALVAATIADARDTMIEGESGILNCLTRKELRGGSEDSGYNRSLGEVFLENGSQFKTFSSEKPRKLRGPQFHFAWGDESAFWADAWKGTITDTTWSNLSIATRLPRRLEWDSDFRSQIVVATTPRPVALLKVTDPDPSRAGLMQRETTIITRGRTTDNIENLSDTYKANVIAPLLGTRLGRQELDAELLEQREDALWRYDWIEETRVAPDDVPDLVRVIVAVDPAVSDGEDSAETGVIVAGASRDGHGYVLGDYTLRGSPKQVMDRVVEVYQAHMADRVVAEVNNGGDYIGHALRAVDPNVPYKTVRATRGKQTRAEPVSALYEQRRVHHVGAFPYLEDQLVTWAPTDEVSPDRLDALVWAFTDLHDLVAASWHDAYGVTKCEKCERVILKLVGGKPRSNCPHCGQPLPDAASTAA